MFIAVTVPHNVGVELAPTGDGIKYRVSPMLRMLPIDVLTLKFTSTAAGAAEFTLVEELIPFKDRSGYSFAPAGVAPVLLIKAYHAPSFFTNHAALISPVVCWSEIKVPDHAESDSKDIVLNILFSNGCSFITLVIVELY